MWGLMRFLATGAFAFTTSVGPSEAQKHDDVRYRYRTPDRTQEFVVRSTGQGTIASFETSKSVYSEGFFDEPNSGKFVECNSTAIRCVMADGALFAIPTGRTIEGQTYSANGAILKIVSCTRSDENGCSAMLVASLCPYLSGDRCTQTKVGRNDEPGRNTFFFYNRDFGVTSFGTGGTRVEDREILATAKELASMYQLAGDNGMLAQLRR